jgi:hypothetical protein
VYSSRPSARIAAAHDVMNSATRVAFGATLAAFHWFTLNVPAFACSSERSQPFAARYARPRQWTINESFAGSRVDENTWLAT